MRVFRIGTYLVSSVIMICSFQNCGQQTPMSSTTTSTVDDGGAMAKSVADLKAQVRTVAAADLSCAADADCAVTGVGQAHCGGPTFLVLNSQKSALRAQLLSLVAQYDQAEGEYMTAAGLVGTCVMLEAPAPKCVSNVCVAGTTSL